jgi:phycocyanobilin:ferredoxin oxidoreductase
VWIGTRPARATIACDLSPTIDDCGARAAQNATTVAFLPAVATVPPGGALPAWCEAIFSPSPLYTRFGPDDVAGACGALEAYLGAFVELTRQSRASGGAWSRTMAPGEVSRGTGYHCLRHRADDRGLLLLERLFDKVRTERYLDEVLFPILIDGCAT